MSVLARCPRHTGPVSGLVKGCTQLVEEKPSLWSRSRCLVLDSTRLLCSVSCPLPVCCVYLDCSSVTQQGSSRTASIVANGGLWC